MLWADVQGGYKRTAYQRRIWAENTMTQDGTVPEFLKDLRTREGVNPKSMIEIDRASECYIGSAGGKPGMENAFLYHDSKYHFYLYASRRWHGSTFDVVVDEATRRRLVGPRPDVLAADLPVIRQNLERFFSERWFMGSAEPRPSNEHFGILEFAWPPPLPR